MVIYKCSHCVEVWKQWLHLQITLVKVLLNWPDITLSPGLKEYNMLIVSFLHGTLLHLAFINLLFFFRKNLYPRRENQIIRYI